MKHVLKSVSSRLETAVLVSRNVPKNLKHGLLLYASEDGLTLAFDDVDYEFDSLESVLDIWASVPKTQVLTRTLQCDNDRQMLQSVTSMLQNVPFTPAVTKFFTREFLKSVTRHMQALESASSYLMTKT